MNGSQNYSLLQTAINACHTVDKYDKIELIGAGTYGQVWKARERATNEIVALKRIRMETEKEGFPITAIREIKILKTCSFANVIQLKEIITSPDPEDLNSVYLVFEYMEHDLAGLLDAEGFKKQFREDHLKCYMRQLLEGLLYLHRSNILHRDIKSANLLINNQGMLKLADFGLARPIERRDAQIKSEKSMSSGSKYTNNVITLWYRPPELLLGAKHYGPAIDIWSAGCVLAELYEKRSPFSGGHKLDSEQLELIWKLVGTPTPESWPTVDQLPLYSKMQPKKAYNSMLHQRFSRYGKEAVDLLALLLRLDPDRRISAEAALDHAYFFTDPEPCLPSQVTPYLVSSHEYTSKSRRRKLHQIQEEGRQPPQQSHSQQHNTNPHPSRPPHNQQHHNNLHNPQYQHQSQSMDQGALKRLKTDHPPHGAIQNSTNPNHHMNNNSSSNSSNFPHNQNAHANPPYQQQVSINMKMSMNVNMFEMNNATNNSNRMQPSPMMSQQGNPNFHGQGYPFQQQNTNYGPQQPCYPPRNQAQQPYPTMHHNPNMMQYPTIQPPPLNPYTNHAPHNGNGQLLPPPPNVDMRSFSGAPPFQFSRLPPQQPGSLPTQQPQPPSALMQQQQQQPPQQAPPQQLPSIDPALVQKNLAELNSRGPPQSQSQSAATPKKPVVKNVLLGNSYQSRPANASSHRDANANSAALPNNVANSSSNMLSQVKRSNETELMNLT